MVVAPALVVFDLDGTGDLDLSAQPDDGVG